jgi:hypothetical protein
MKNIFTLICLLAIGLSANAQITINNSDMPNTNDTLRVSLANAPAGTDLSLTGPSYTWDFSALAWNTQTVDTFLATSATASLYALYFVNVGFNPNRASIATKGNILANIPGLPISDVYNFYFESTSLFQQVGFGANISGITTPIAYGNKDVIYNFPLNYGDVDSSDSDYSISLTGLGAAIGSQKRVNNVDGWGTLITPYGTFSTLRVVSDLTGRDSIYLDTLGFGFSAPRVPAREYKWLGTAQGIPLLQINTRINGGNETITSVRYRDIYRSVTTSINQNEVPQFTATIYPNPTYSNNASLRLFSKNSERLSLNILDAKGAIVFSEVIQLSASKEMNYSLDKLAHLNHGIYHIQLSSKTTNQTLNWIK